jgi:hypothetical protein
MAMGEFTEQERRRFADLVVSKFLKQEMPEIYKMLVEGGQIIEAPPCNRWLEADCELS